MEPRFVAKLLYYKALGLYNFVKGFEGEGRGVNNTYVLLWCSVKTHAKNDYK